MQCAINRAALVALALALAACGANQDAAPTTPSKLSLVDVGPHTIDLQIEGQSHLRAISAALVYDPGALELDRIEPGHDAPWLDTARLGDGAGKRRIVIADSRQIPLPRSGVLARLTYLPKRPGAVVEVQLTEVVGAVHGGAADVTAAPVKVTVQ
jgi:hypothetical protein